jgi:hypothetical protein
LLSEAAKTPVSIRAYPSLCRFGVLIWRSGYWCGSLDGGFGGLGVKRT